MPPDLGLVTTDPCWEGQPSASLGIHAFSPPWSSPSAPSASLRQLLAGLRPAQLPRTFHRPSLLPLQGLQSLIELALGHQPGPQPLRLLGAWPEAIGLAQHPLKRLSPGGLLNGIPPLGQAAGEGGLLPGRAGIGPQQQGRPQEQGDRSTQGQKRPADPAGWG
jgi:hypothetical protein